MATATSVTTTVDPPAVKKRGRPRKDADESIGAPEPTAARKASTKAKAATKTKTKTQTIDAMKEKKKTLTKVSDYKTKKETSAPKAAANTTQQPTPVTPTSSKILDEVKAAGAFRKSSSPRPPTEPKQPFIPPVPGPAPVAPILPDATESSMTEASATLSPSETVAPEPDAASAPVQQPIDKPSSKPVIPPTTSAPSERANINPPKARTTTIPLPRNPLGAPSPISEPSSSRVAFAEPAPRAPPRAPRYPSRLIEPNMDMKLPPKYKKASRQVTSIIVGIPFVIVVGYELYVRWRAQITKTFEEREARNATPRQVGE